MIAIAGGITSLAHYREFCAFAQADIFMRSAARIQRSGAKAEALAGSDRDAIHGETGRLAEAFFACHLR